MYQVGIDIGSSAAKTAVIKDGEVVKTYLLNTGFSSRKTAEDIYQMLEKDGIHKDNAAYVATGYGRISVPYADKSVTEITCHGKGAWHLGLTMEELSDLASRGNPITISSMCTVFAESEVISLIGKGTPREDIAYGVIESVVTKVVQLISQVVGDQYFLTGGLCEDPYILERLSLALHAPVESVPLARYAGAIGAALTAAV